MAKITFNSDNQKITVSFKFVGKKSCRWGSEKLHHSVRIYNSTTKKSSTFNVWASTLVDAMDDIGWDCSNYAISDGNYETFKSNFEDYTEKELKKHFNNCKKIYGKMKKVMNEFHTFYNISEDFDTFEKMGTVKVVA